jgi:hypothetical protein
MRSRPALQERLLGCDKTIALKQLEVLVFIAQGLRDVEMAFTANDRRRTHRAGATNASDDRPWTG